MTKPSAMTVHPVSFVGAPLLVAGIQLSALATCLGSPLIALGAGLVSLMSVALLALGGEQ